MRFQIFKCYDFARMGFNFRLRAQSHNQLTRLLILSGESVSQRLIFFPSSRYRFFLSVGWKNHETSNRI